MVKCQQIHNYQKLNQKNQNKQTNRTETES